MGQRYRSDKLQSDNLGMQNPEVTTQLTPPTLLEGFAGMGFAYVTTISDGTIKVTGRGPSPEDAHEVAQLEWELAHSINNEITLP